MARAHGCRLIGPHLAANASNTLWSPTMNTKRMFGEANLALCGATLGLVLLAPSAIAATTDAAAMQLASKYNCQTCHTVDKSSLGRRTRKSPRSTPATRRRSPSSRRRSSRAAAASGARFRCRRTPFPRPTSSRWSNGSSRSSRGVSCLPCSRGAGRGSTSRPCVGISINGGNQS